ncbi:EAL domain-containing protein [Telluria mixta]|uniref:EAL domain-containing protein n=1 Tax=Telluria mixta TaxID=34071 RepID=A0ABT2C4L2_9BURK|nr:EAL domain-containing protein [Telluria mixta]MCS0632132.1 EAL domain-containing protein [Telluria mixta]WEM95194.1 EAL domain-containing protein [Telluria mixta]
MPVSNTPPGAAQDDDLVFADETPADAAVKDGAAWRVLIVDDDADVHSTTTFALGTLDMHGRPLEFLHAYSAAEAIDVLARERDIAVILLDVVMEQADAGLHLVRHVRDTLGRHDVRIILRTGQPGYAPEMDAIRGYDINDYRTKSELTRTKLYTSVAAAIRAYQQIHALEDSRTGLAEVVRANTELMALHTVGEMTLGILREVAALAGQPADGLLCACPPGLDAVGWQVLASCGPSADLAHDGMLATGGQGPAGAIARALAEGRNLYEPDHLALYFSGKAHRHFAAWLKLKSPLDALRRGLIDVFTSSIAVGLDNVALMTALHRAAFYDGLTSLPNRTRLVELIDDSLQARVDTTLCLVDIDQFAETNDALGHQFGDALLVAVAQRLRTRLDAQVVLARIGGDIFCLLGEAGLIDPAAVQDLFAAPFSIEGQDVQVSATLGLVRLLEHDGTAADALKDADIALKRAKSQRRGGHFYFSRGMGVEIRERVRLMHALRGGFARGELFLAYQPQVELAARRAFGAEALLRWRTEDGRFVPPDRFIPIAEYSGLIIDIGAWVLREACAELVRVRAAGHLDFTMSINVSQVQFRHPHFIDMLRQALADTGAPPERVELEITESMAMEEPDLLIERLAEIKRTGVSIAIDDFGTGFSSLSYLQRLCVDRLKIDRAFVTEITDAARGSSIAEMVIELGRNLGLSIIAEGVEDEVQAQILQALGCPLAQGYLFARPLAPEALIEWLGSDALTRAA